MGVQGAAATLRLCLGLSHTLELVPPWERVLSLLSRQRQQVGSSSSSLTVRDWWLAGRSIRPDPCDNRLIALVRVGGGRGLDTAERRGCRNTRARAR